MDFDHGLIAPFRSVERLLELAAERATLGADANRLAATAGTATDLDLSLPTTCPRRRHPRPPRPGRCPNRDPAPQQTRAGLLGSPPLARPVAARELGERLDLLLAADGGIECLLVHGVNTFSPSSAASTADVNAPS